MAENPPNPDAVSSYSDPIYDRLEGLLNQLGRRWWLFVVAALICGTAGLLITNALQHSPEAASSAASIDARGDREALETLVDDESITYEFRARSALSAAQHALDAGDPAAARRLLDTALDHATEAGLEELQLTVHASLGAVAETTGDWDAASAAYGKVLQRTDQTTHPGLNLSATLGAARVELGAAAEVAEDDPETARERRGYARELLVFAVDATPDADYGDYPQHVLGSVMGRARPGAIDLGAAARYLLVDLDRRFPEVTGSEALPAPGEAAAPAEEAGNTAADEAEAEAEAEADDAEE